MHTFLWTHLEVILAALVLTRSLQSVCVDSYPLSVSFTLDKLLISLYLSFLNCERRTVTATATKSLQSCPTLCDPIDSGPPGSPVSGLLQARTLEWVAISFFSFPLKLEEVTVQYTQAKSYLTL